MDGQAQVVPARAGVIPYFARDKKAHWCCSRASGGDPQRGWKTALTVRVVPARAGVILKKTDLLEDGMGCSRASGGDPAGMTQEEVQE